MSTPTPLRTEPFAVARPGPAVWLLGAHGGAGVSTLTHYLVFAGDSGRQWPCGTDREVESPYVVIVARETITGLKTAHELIVEHRERTLPCEVLGLVTVAGSQRIDKAVRQYRSVVTASVPQHWSIGWHRFLSSAALSGLPTWHPFDGMPPQTKKTVSAVPADVIEAGVGIVTAIQRSLLHLRSAR